MNNLPLGKETEPIGLSEGSPFKEVGKDIELPKEVAQAGVSAHPTTVSLPQSVAQLGVKPVGSSVQTQAPVVPLPLTDDQIAAGLQQGMTSSWHWLALWCVRKLKKFHMGLRAIGGHMTRVSQ